MNLIETQNLSKTYEGEGVRTTALRAINLSIKAGEFVAIMGPSGSGKSTLLHVLGFLDRHSAGTYRYRDKPAQGYSDNELAGIRNQQMGFIFQAFNLLAKATVLENVKLPLIYSDLPDIEWDSRAKKAIESVGLSHRLNHESSQLSGGEKQRVAIARALITNPELIFADEPTGNLDSKSGQSVMEIIQRLNEDHGKTVILITHETYTAEHARRIIRIKDGLLESDTLVERRHRAQDDFRK